MKHTQRVLSAFALTAALILTGLGTSACNGRGQESQFQITSETENQETPAAGALGPTVGPQVAVLNSEDETVTPSATVPANPASEEAKAAEEKEPATPADPANSESSENGPSETRKLLRHPALAKAVLSASDEDSSTDVELDWKPKDGKCESNKGENASNSPEDCRASGGGGGGGQPHRATVMTY